MAQAHASLTRLYTARDRLNALLVSAKPGKADGAGITEKVEEIRQRFLSGMDNDFNTAEAMGAVFDLAYLANTELDEGSGKEAVQAVLSTLAELTGVLGLLARGEESVPEDVQAVADRRAEARKNRDWAQSDALRAELAQMGWLAEDTPQGQKLRRA